MPVCLCERHQQKEEEYLKYETTQRIAFDTFLAKKGQHLDALSRSDELKVLVRNGVPRDYRAHVRWGYCDWQVGAEQPLTRRAGRAAEWMGGF